MDISDETDSYELNRGSRTSSASYDKPFSMNTAENRMSHGSDGIDSFSGDGGPRPFGENPFDIAHHHDSEQHQNRKQHEVPGVNHPEYHFQNRSQYPPPENGRNQFSFQHDQSGTKPFPTVGAASRLQPNPSSTNSFKSRSYEEETSTQPRRDFDEFQHRPGNVVPEDTSQFSRRGNRNDDAAKPTPTPVTFDYGHGSNSVVEEPLFTRDRRIPSSYENDLVKRRSLELTTEDGNGSDTVTIDYGHGTSDPVPGKQSLIVIESIINYRVTSLAYCRKYFTFF